MLRGHQTARRRVRERSTSCVQRTRCGCKRIACSSRRRRCIGAEWFSAADALFASLAETYKSGAVGVVLSGMMAVGVNGLNKIRRAGGTVIAQNRATSLCFDMPAAACDLAKAEIRLAPAGIAEALCAMAAI